MRNLYLCGRDDFHRYVYRYGDCCDFDSDSYGLWFTVQEGKDTTYFMPYR